MPSSAQEQPIIHVPGRVPPYPGALWSMPWTLRGQVWDKQEGDLAEPMSQDWTLVPVILMTAASEQSEIPCSTSVPAQNFSKNSMS